MRKRSVLVFTAIFVAVVATVAMAEEARIPFLVIEDSNGDVIGPVVSMSAANSPVIRIMDSGVDVPLFVTVRGDTSLAGTQSTTHFSLDNCQGSTFHEAAPTDENGLAELTGYYHSVARVGNPGGDQQLYRSDLAVGAISTPVESRYQSNGTCQDVGGSVTARPATLVMNLDTEYPPPYDVR